MVAVGHYTFLIDNAMCRNLREDSREVPYGYLEPLHLHDEVLRFNPDAFDFNAPGKESVFSYFHKFISFLNFSIFFSPSYVKKGKYSLHFRCLYLFVSSSFVFFFFCIFFLVIYFPQI